MSKGMNAMLMLVTLASLTLSTWAALLHPINGSLCINSNYTLNYSLPRPVQADVECAGICDDMPRCQAFTTEDGPCQLFVFDKCSKYVRNCNCTRRGQVFVKQQPGLGPGALCPSGFGDLKCGVKYKWTNPFNNWGQSRQACEAEAGFTIMADMIDIQEINHTKALFARDVVTDEWIWLGGYQHAGSTEPVSGWYWVGCNITVASNLWNGSPDVEPNNSGGNENVISIKNNRPLLLHDLLENQGTFKGLCEWLSPFD